MCAPQVPTVAENALTLEKAYLILKPLCAHDPEGFGVHVPGSRGGKEGEEGEASE